MHTRVNLIVISFECLPVSAYTLKCDSDVHGKRVAIIINNNRKKTTLIMCEKISLKNTEELNQIKSNSNHIQPSNAVLHVLRSY